MHEKGLNIPRADRRKQLEATTEQPRTSFEPLAPKVPNSIVIARAARRGIRLLK